MLDLNMDMTKVGNTGMSKETTHLMEDRLFSPDLLRFLRYLQFKQECMQYQFENPIRLDIDLAVSCRDTLLKQQEEKVEQLKQVMPNVKKLKWQNRPKNTHKKDGSLSVAGTNWFNALKENGINPASEPAKKVDRLKVFSHWEEPNPKSTDQVKSWLYDLGWKPCTYKFTKDKDTGDERQIEQVRKDGELTPSVLRLKEDTPEVEILEGLTIIQHRLGIFQGFIECALERDGKYYLRAEIGGLTNTLRFKHKKPLVNLPGVDKPWGKEVRSCLIADEREVFIGADMTSLEDTTKRHYIYPLDPDYVDEMSKEGFDPHLDLALHAGAITEQQLEDHKTGKQPLDMLRKKYKAANYSCVYGVGKAKLARETGMTQKEAGKVIEDYWKRNWAVKKVAQEQFTKEVGGYTWLKNPVSGFWHELRYDKDRWSTTNQSTAVYVFDSWLARARLKGYNGQASFHDETLASVADESRSREALKYGLNKLNEDLSLNVDFGIDTKVGGNYSDVH